MQREQFEAHWCRDVPSMYRAAALAEIRANRADERYGRDEIQWAWEAWQAALLSASNPAAPAQYDPDERLGTGGHAAMLLLAERCGISKDTTNAAVIRFALACRDDAAPAQSHLTSNAIESNDRQIDAPAQSGEPVAWTADQLYDAIETVLLSHKLSNWQDQYENLLGLVDRLCDDDARDISSGQHAIRLICDEIYNEVLTVAAPQPSQPAQSAVQDDERAAWEYSFIHSSATGRGDSKVGPCLTYDRDAAYGVGCIEQREVMVSFGRAASPQATQPAQTRALTADDADMVWPQDDGEIMHHSLDDAVEYEIQQAWPVEAPLEFTFQAAKRIPDVTIRVTEITENGHEWEIVTAAQPASGQKEGE